MTTTVSTAVLKAVPLFSSFPEDALRTLTSMVARKSVSRSTTVMTGGDPTDSLYIVLSGRLKVMMSDAEGKEVILTILGPGDSFGEMGLIDDEPRSATVVAIEPCELLYIAKRDFKKCLAENFDMAMAVMRGLVRRLREADRKIGSLALLDVYGRVARLLLDMSENVDGEKIVTKRPAQAGHRQDDRRLEGDGEPRHEGPADGRLHRDARLEHRAARFDRSTRIGCRFRTTADPPLRVRVG
jgi:CRP/FNR family cyclic AMP-dependent transcriptional regulator